MKRSLYFLFFGFVLFLSGCKTENKEQQLLENEVAENPIETPAPTTPQEPWTEQQLLEPRDLAQIIQTSSDSLVIISLGAGGIIPGSKDTGPSGEKEGLENLRHELKGLSKDADIVLYCGCCPFNICPNVRPAFSLLNEMEFTNHQLLNLRENIKVDWIDRGFPTAN